MKNPYNLNLIDLVFIVTNFTANLLILTGP